MSASASTLRREGIATDEQRVLAEIDRRLATGKFEF